MNNLSSSVKWMLRNSFKSVRTASDVNHLNRQSMYLVGFIHALHLSHVISGKFYLLLEKAQRNACNKRFQQLMEQRKKPAANPTSQAS